MGLHIRDNGVNELAGLAGQGKIQDVRRAIELRLRAPRSPAVLRERMARLRGRARAAGIGPDASTEEAADKGAHGRALGRPVPALGA